MAISLVDSNGGGGFSGPDARNPVGGPLAISATAKLLVIFIITPTTTARSGTAPTWAGGAMTQAGSTQAGSAECTAELWYKINPATGTQTLAIPNTAFDDIYWDYATFGGSGITLFGTPVQTGTTAANPSLTINNVPAGGMCAAVLGDGYKDVPTGQSHTSLNSTDQGAFTTNSQYGLIASLSNVTMSWTVASDDVAMIMAAFQDSLAALSIGSGGTFAQAAKVSENLAAAVAAQTALAPSVSQAGKVTEALGAAVLEAEALPLDISTPVQAAAVTEDLAAAVAAQTTLEIAETDSARAIEDLTAAVGEQVEFEIEVSQSGRVTESLAGEVAAQVTLEASSTDATAVSEALVSDIPIPAQISQAATVAEALAGAVEAQVDLEASASQAGAVTEALAGTVGEAPAEEPLLVQVEQEVHLTEWFSPPFTETIGISDTVIAEFLLDINISTPVQAAAVTEDLAASISTPLVLEASADQAAAVSEDLASAVATPVTLEASIADNARMTEARTVTVEGMAATLEVLVAEAVRTTEATAAQVIAQVALELAAVDSVAVVTTDLTAAIAAAVDLTIEVDQAGAVSEDLAAAIVSQTALSVEVSQEGAVMDDLTVSIEAAPAAGRGRFRRIPGRTCIAGGFVCIPGDTPIDGPDMEKI